MAARIDRGRSWREQLEDLSIPPPTDERGRTGKLIGHGTTARIAEGGPTPAT